MDTTHSGGPSSYVIAELCRQLLALARREDEAAADEAARLAYWEPCPPTVHGHREAARSLRETAFRLTAQPPVVSLGF